MKLYQILFMSCLVMLLAFSGCDDEDPEMENDEELITTLVVTFSSGGETVEQRFEDLDGDGGGAPVITTEALERNTVYIVTLTFLNESVTPAENITVEIREEAEEHQVFFGIGSGLGMIHEYEDQDDNNNPIGLTNTIITGAAGNGTFKVTLRHEPDKFAQGVSDGDITNAGGETDIEVTFDLEVE